MQNNDKNYNSALNLCENNFSHDELIDFLKNGDIVQKQYAALNIDILKSSEEAKTFISNLVGVDGKIREVVAIKLIDFTNDYPKLFHNPEIFENFVKATIDIDGNVCRCVILSAFNLIMYDDFTKYYTNGLIKIIDEALCELKKITYKDKKYKTNKQIFKIYWALESLILFIQKIKLADIKRILKECSIIQDYVIREKCAQIIVKIDLDEELSIIIDKLKSDSNYYVRNVFK